MIPKFVLLRQIKRLQKLLDPTSGRLISITIKPETHREYKSETWEQWKQRRTDSEIEWTASLYELNIKGHLTRWMPVFGGGITGYDSCIICGRLVHWDHRDKLGRIKALADVEFCTG